MLIQEKVPFEANHLKSIPQTLKTELKTEKRKRGRKGKRRKKEPVSPFLCMAGWAPRIRVCAAQGPLLAPVQIGALGLEAQVRCRGCRVLQFPSIEPRPDTILRGNDAPLPHTNATVPQSCQVRHLQSHCDPKNWDSNPEPPNLQMQHTKVKMSAEGVTSVSEMS